VEGLKASLRDQLRNFWRGHIEGWRQSDLNQREYCELHGLPLKRFGNWRAALKHEDTGPERKVRWRRGLSPGHGAGHMASHMANTPAAPVAEEPVAGPAAAPTGKRRQFGEDDKRRIVEEACQPGASLSGVARRYGIGVRLLFRWKQALGLGAAEAPALLAVRIMDGAGASSDSPPAEIQPAPAMAPVIIERITPGIEIELIGGRRVRFDRDVDPETVRRLVSVLEGDRP
jgi:transposase-like protein